MTTTFDRRQSSIRHRLRGALGVFLVLSLLAAACGGGDDTADGTDTTTDATSGVTPDPVATAEDATEDPTTVPDPTPTAEPTAVPTPESSAAQSIDEVHAATVKILAEGSFVSPGESDRSSSAGVGTGFIIEESGLAVTNNHVVTGAAFLQVWVKDQADPVNAKILGVSECNDLALIDLEGDGWPTLDFRVGDVSPGLDVFAAGYPVTDSTSIGAVDYTLTRGIISNVTASGETQWASVDSVLEHDARIRGGNSGGPLVDEDGKVVGVNYAGNTDDQSFAISAGDALHIIDQLRNGDVESIGINGEAIVIEDGPAGLWIASVDSGSPADRAGVEAGDLMVSMEGIDLASDGTMADYCDILRTNGPDDVLDIEIVRLSTEEFFIGQINGDPLEVSFSFAAELAADVESSPSTGGANDYLNYEFVSDDSGAVGVEVPVEWAQRDGAVNENFGPSLWASTDLEAFAGTFDVPGLIVEVSDQLGPADLDTVLDGISFAACTGSGREDFQTMDEFFTGKWEFFFDCGGTDTLIIALAVVPPTEDMVVRMVIQVVDDRDLAAADQALASFDAGF